MTRAQLVASVLQDVAAKRGSYAEIGARYGLTKSQVSGMVQRSRGTRYKAQATRRLSTVGNCGGHDWESRLFEPYATRKVRLAQERARVG